MLDTLKAHEGDLVELTEEIPGYDLKIGQRGFIIEAFSEPAEAYDIEFEDEEGEFLGFAYSVKPEQIVNIDAVAKEAFERGLSLFNSGRHPEAEREFRRAIGLKGSYLPLLHNLIIKHYVNSEDWLRTIISFRFLLQLSPEYSLARNNLARAYLNLGIQEAKKGNVEKSLDLFYAAIGIESASETISLVKQYLAAAYTQLGIQKKEEMDLQRSLDCMAKACSVDPNKSTRHNLGLAYSLLGNSKLKNNEFSEAIFLFERAEDAGLAIPALYNNHAVALVSLGDFEGAINFLERALELSPGYEIARANLLELREGRIGVDGKPLPSSVEIEFDYEPAPPMQVQDYQMAA
jgi:tetratricopeptide (TPR) repeat protein